MTWAEAATLAVLPNAPSLIYPGRNSERLRLKRDRLAADAGRKGSYRQPHLLAGDERTVTPAPLCRCHRLPRISQTGCGRPTGWRSLHRAGRRPAMEDQGKREAWTTEVTGLGPPSTRPCRKR
ncbi:MAG: transglycosylase domain-containing protein [Marinilabiliales bacterium]|nr:transglycosylase domain-containing protein [Marinilabiliales bacterium]